MLVLLLVDVDKEINQPNSYVEKRKKKKKEEEEWKNRIDEADALLLNSSLSTETWVKKNFSWRSCPL